MRTIQYVRAGCLIGTLGACMLMASLAQADVTTERPGSLLIFPKVVQAGGRETVIQITNTGNSVDNLHCFYIDGESGPSGHPLCSVTDFFISLTKQQPTHWDASTGRPVNPTDKITGFDPGQIPPVAPGFTGALVCAEVGDDDVPLAQNKIKGEATLEGPNGDVSKYNGIAVQGNANCGANNGDNVLSLGGEAPEYNACPTASVFNFIPDGAPDPVIEALGVGGTCSGGDRVDEGCNNDADCPAGTCTTGQSHVVSTITALPCNLDFQTQVATKFSLSYRAYDNDEQPYTGSSGPLSCWASIDLADISAAVSTSLPGGSQAGPFASIRITAVTGGPVLLVGETFHVDAENRSAAAAVNLHMLGLCQAAGAQSPSLAQTCQTPADCPDGSTFILSQSSTITLPALAP